jgi:hypothetical protein
MVSHFESLRKDGFALRFQDTGGPSTTIRSVSGLYFRAGRLPRAEKRTALETDQADEADRERIRSTVLKK